MVQFVVKRLIGIVLTLFVILSLSFFIIRLAPGSPFSGEKALAAGVKEVLEKEYGLHDSLLHQFFLYGAHVLKGDLGRSTRYGDRSVNEILKLALPSSVLLGFSALAWALMLGFLSGWLSALRAHHALDKFLSAISVLGLALPSFVVAPILILIFSLTLYWLPPAGWGTFQHILLPSFSLGLIYAAYISRLSRTGLIEILNADFITTAKAKGASTSRILFFHALKGSLIPVLGFLGPAIVNLMVGSVVIEKIFNTPGLGPYLVDAAINRDYFLVMGIIIFYSVLLLFLNLLVDILYARLDPRVRLS